MILVDKKILLGGIAMLVVGIAITLYLESIIPIGVPGMTDDAKLELELAQQELEDYSTLAGILMAVGFLLILISFGARRKRKGGAVKKMKKPAQ